LFVIDPEGVIRWSYVSPVDINPGADGILKALEPMVKDEKAVSCRREFRSGVTTRIMFTTRPEADISEPIVRISQGFFLVHLNESVACRILWSAKLA